MNKNRKIHQNIIRMMLLAVCFCGLLSGKKVQAADTTWQADYSYERDMVNHYIKLKQYNGTAAELTVPAAATIDDVEYTTLVGSEKIWSQDTNLTSLSFEPGIIAGENLTFLFSDCTKLESLSLSDFDTSGTRDMYGMFRGCSSLKSLSLSNFDTGKVRTAQYMFQGCSSLTDLDLSSFDTSNVTSMESMFQGCSSLTDLDVSTFDTAGVESMAFMFRECKELTYLDVSHFDTGKTTSMAYMFRDCEKLTALDVSAFNTSSVKSMDAMFQGCSSLESLDVSHFDTRKVTSVKYMFYRCSSLESLDVSHFDTANITTMEGMFDSLKRVGKLDVSGFHTGNVKSMAYMFHACEAVEELDLGSFDTSNVTDMRFMFNGCAGLASLDPGSFNTAAVTSMRGLFCGCCSLKSLDLKGFNTAAVTDMAKMFNTCTSLTSLDISGFDTSNVTDMMEMFYGCAFQSLDLGSFNTSNVANMTNMFYNCKNLLSLDLSGFDGAKLTAAGSLIDNCESLQNFQTPAAWPFDIALPGVYYDLEYNFYSSWAKDTEESLLLGKCPVDASDARIHVADQLYTGSSLKPEIVVTLNGIYIADSNYSVSYSNNTEVGNATVTVTFSGNFSGKVSRNFRIVKEAETIEFDSGNGSDQALDSLTVLLSLSADKGYAYKWTIDDNDKNYATVSDGGLLVFNEVDRQVTVRLTLRKGSKVIIKKRKYYAAAAKIKAAMKKSTAALKKGKSLTTGVTASRTGSGVWSPSYTWKSSNSKVVSVKGSGANCKLTGNKKGKATITCKVKNGKKRKSCTLKVTVN